MNIPEITKLAERKGYKLQKHVPATRVLIFNTQHAEHGAVQVNVFYTTGTVATCLNHPRKGKTQLFRRGVNLRTLEGIFENPRLHGLGGYTRSR